MVTTPDSKIHGANMGPTWVLSAPDGPHVGPMNLAIRDALKHHAGSPVQICENRCLHASSSLFCIYCCMRWSNLRHHMAFGDTRHDTNNMAYAMVTYSLRPVCGGRTATLVPQIVRGPYDFYANRTATSWFSAHSKVIASLTSFLNFTLNFFSETAMPQHRNHTAKSPYGGLAMAVRWHTLFTLSWVPRKSHGGLTASLRRPHGVLTANLW